jgi:hypothetical protein
VQGILEIPAQRHRASVRGGPLRLWLGLALLVGSWWWAWFGPPPISYHTFFPLWLGYIMTVDGITVRRSGTSLLARSPREFALLFLLSVPLWWLFELANRYLGNWRYLLPYPYDLLTFTLVASLSFSTVMPAIFVTAELLRALPPFASSRIWRRIAPVGWQVVAISLVGLAMFLLSLGRPREFFPLVWIGLVLVLDPLNEALGNPSIIAQLRRGRWDTIVVLFAAGLTCGLLWELWNVRSMPKWIYEVPFVGNPKLFEMPIIGYGGYLPFALEVFAIWSFLRGLLPGHAERWVGFTHSAGWRPKRQTDGVQPC